MPELKEFSEGGSRGQVNAARERKWFKLMQIVLSESSLVVPMEQKYQSDTPQSTSQLTVLSVSVSPVQKEFVAKVEQECA